MNLADLVIVKGTGFISTSIEDITHSQYSHIAGYIGDDALVEAEGFEKTGQVPLNKYDGMYDVYTCDILTDEQRNKVIKYIKNEIGGRYDYMLLVIELFRYLFHISLPYRESYKSHICSTLWHDAYRSVGIYLCPNIKYPSPQEISESKLLRKISK